MDRSIKRKLLIGTVAGLAVAGGGAAVAATQLDSSGESQAVVTDAAKRLGVQPSALSDALKQALSDRIDAAVAAGRLTKDEGDVLKARIQSGDFPLFFGAGHEHHFGGFHGLEVAGSYLGLTPAELRADLEGGKTLAQVAKDQGKSVDGLVQALENAAKARLDEAVAAGRLSKTEEQSILANVHQRITAFVNGTFKGHEGFHFRHGDRDEWH